MGRCVNPVAGEENITMMHQLDHADFGKVRSLFDQLAEIHFYVRAVLSGDYTGTLHVDDPNSPRTALMEASGEFFLVGRPDNAAFNRAMNQYFNEKWFKDEGSDENNHLYFSTLAEWETVLEALFSPRRPVIMPRLRYSCIELDYTDWRDHIPDGYSLQAINGDSFDTLADNIQQQVKKWARNWTSFDRFLERGLGMCMLHDGEIVSRSSTNCISSNVCEIGIITDPAHRRRGLAAITVAAMVEAALSHEYKLVGWQCSPDNLGSWKTAERVGFVKECDYVEYYIYCHRVDDEVIARAKING
jgi:RimJ/RimL family protein N-acetyltransferase